MTSTRSLLAPPLALVAATALALGGCGGGDSSTPATTATAPTKPPAREAEQGGKDESQGQNQGKSKEQSAQQHPRNAPTAPLRVSGGGSEQFEVKGGDNSVQEYGTEADEAELREAARAVHAFFVARISGEYQRACSLLARPQVKSLEQLAQGSPTLRGKGCPGALAALTKQVSPTLARQLTSVDAGSLRSEGEQSFLIYTGAPGRTVYAMPLRREGGAWKLAAVSGAALPGA